MNVKNVAFSILLAAAGSIQANAVEIRIGVQAEANGIDPHHHSAGQDNQVRYHMFDSLIDKDEKQKIKPSLAKSWKVLGPTTWEFQLRDDVYFHNGTKFTANDFVYTVCRVRNYKEASISFSVFTAPIKTITVPNPTTLVIETNGPYPAILNELSTISVISAPVHGIKEEVKLDSGDCGIKTWPKSTDFISGAAMIGTGPYKFVEYTRGSHITMTRNEAYWGGRPEWDRVTIRPIPNAAARVSALLAGDVDIIDAPPPSNIDQLESNSNITLASGPSQVFLYLHFQHRDEPAVGISGTNGKNPFRLKDVRKAVSMAIDRQAIVNRIMRGHAEIATNVMGPDYPGHNPDIKLDPYDPAVAKALLTRAGYPNGFRVVFGVTNDRFPNDSRIGQTIAQMLARIGITVDVEVSPYSVYAQKWRASQYSFYLGGLAGSSFDMGQTLRALVGTQGFAPGFGQSNYGFYSDPETDKIILAGVREMDVEKRRAYLQEANKRVVENYALLPLIHPNNMWAHRKTLTFVPRNDNSTVALSAHPVK